jgi:glycosyltransferase involved in cell wall biosynthesis
MVAYPAFSETYMHEEIRSLREQFEIKIITYRKSTRQRLRAWEYTRIEYKDPCLVYSPIEEINQDFNDPSQLEFLRRVDAVIEEFKPDVMHGHYFGLSLLLKQLAEKHGTPFTLRTHSMDILSEPIEKLEACSKAANSPWCKRVLAFPASCERLADRGLDPGKIESCWPVMNFRRFYNPLGRPLTERVMCCGPAIEKKAHKDFIDLAAKMRGRSELQFDLYARGHFLRATQIYNLRRGGVVNIAYVDPDEMSDVYPRYDWFIYPSDPGINKVGLPVGIAEAQASGLGVCWQELPGRRQEQLDYLGGGGFLFKSIDELPEILSRPYPEEMRLLGFEAARRCDIEEHKSLLSSVWESIADGAGSTAA